MRRGSTESEYLGWYRHPHRDSSSARDAVNRTQPAIPPADNDPTSRDPPSAGSAGRNPAVVIIQVM